MNERMAARATASLGTSGVGSGKTSLINNQIQTGKSKGMISMDHSLSELVRGGVVEPAEALEHALDRETFKAMIAALPKDAAPGPSPAGTRPAPSRPAAAK